MVKDLAELVAKLKNNAKVISIIEYGSRSFEHPAADGDYDIFVIVEERLYSIESLHFYINGIPVDLNIRVIEDLKAEKPLSFLDFSIFEGRIIYDKNNTVANLLRENKIKWKKKQEQLPELEIVFERFSKKHVLDKVKGRLDSNPLLCHLLLNTNIYWLLHSYFRFNGLVYPGEKTALNYIRKKEPLIYQEIAEFYQKNALADKVRITERLSELILKNVGGLWHQNEIIAFGVNNQVKNLSEKGKKVYDILLKECNCV